ncbi:MAG: hypothetical protein A2268_13315 [Candidatus Raymondbacteria bacterium RifOxyA12_full_50_37]|uniref:Polysaccharide chain length determinant N-terminal domain-containing protein n=1 Tax=Candidatus Raymondbacteria bacterium RIFOXYD12_FULL_49_13 TaxID=1817890 RepID=A0A1F7EZZ2_UNCRA|nr:MAG: hypothetical protein A2268_13315 [Candidatus Raymondbacteria bacterium RifOxyA12_full_50_37]OGJ93041.1 MAG: hypothetical protein A2248_18450 [Candidatus Raymondbacteria bacterium RIFOXYA2_FULL_49_16]OGJ94874.1 MAG: hypothetical protein A2350_15505 [Candidatus Raymondbacteria bacterium RifOxyB12_full_50_8]OGJ99954.1 MAG: hypothetical protein A2519_00430 [Candidatus Raymondbacteria bacterium RIFOXYD12_FULL_49_13]OGK04145.1 MAG: hypothetical protein A2487_14110 [Candidatus Raymondbacteria 
MEKDRDIMALQSHADSDVLSSDTKKDEIDLIQALILFWNYRSVIIAGTMFVSIIGLVYAFLATPIYHSNAVVAPKESQKSNSASAVLSQLGGFGGSVASQLGLGNTNMDRIGIILQGRDLAQKVIEENRLMPILYADKWDTVKGKWNTEDTSSIPKLWQGIEKLRTIILKISIDDKKNVITIGADHKNPIMAKQIVDFYLTALNARLREDIVQESRRNQIYLTSQLHNAADPIIKDKIRDLVASEIEKSMLVSTQSIDIIEKTFVPNIKSRPKRKMILMTSFFLGLFFSIIGIIGYKFYENIRHQISRK